MGDRLVPPNNGLYQDENIRKNVPEVRRKGKKLYCDFYY